MTFNRTIISVWLLFSSVLTAFSQELTSSIRGRVVDFDSESPLAFATVVILNTNLGAVTDEKGEFQIDQIPVGRCDLQVTILGYDPVVLNGIMVTSGKIQSVEIRLKESISTLKEIVIKEKKEKEQPLNKMATVSARQLSVEEANKYAGGFDDPARLVSSFAGVTTGSLTSNGIIVRGNAPKGLLWRMEGVEIPNPNHFGEIAGFGAGGITALSSQMLANSDFLTGAFPAEYGNALSGVFDLSMRRGNTSKREHTLSIGTIGVDVSSEGPIKKGKPASYLFNYRYSSLGLVDYILPMDLGIRYQDFSYKIYIPSEKNGIFSVWGLSFKDNQDVVGIEDSTEWKFGWEKNYGKNSILTGVTGISHQYFLNEDTYLKTTLAASYNKLTYDWNTLNNSREELRTEDITTVFSGFTVTSLLNHKFNAAHTNRSGIVVQNLGYNLDLKFRPETDLPLETIVSDKGSSFLFQAYTQSSYRLGEKVLLNPGLNVQYFLLNGKTSVEPRLGFKWQFEKTQAISFGYGKHSRIEKLNFYLADVTTLAGKEKLNKDMDFTKAHHFVIGYDKMFGENTHLKIEPYYQHLYSIPVIADSSFSFINLQYDWFINSELINSGKARNIGIDITLERFLNQGWYYLFTASVFDAKYLGGDGIWRNSMFNRNFVTNILIGKEWMVGKNKQHQLSVSGRFTYMLGERWTPHNEAASLEAREMVFDYSRTYGIHAPSNYFLHTTITYRRNHKNYSGLWSVQIMNTLGSPQSFGYGYNTRDHRIDPIKETIIIPNISYKIQF